MSKKILVADDNRHDLALIQVHLEGSGYQVIVAHDGQEALEKTADQKPDLLLIDIKMPKLDGDEVYNMLRLDDKTRQLPILVMTALWDEEDIAQQHHEGDVFAKPIVFPKLMERIRAILGE